MEQNSEGFYALDRVCWEEPMNHAVVKSEWRGVIIYEIYTLKPKLMMKLCDDLDYANRLAAKMIEYGVRFFSSSEEFDEWYKMQ